MWKLKLQKKPGVTYRAYSPSAMTSAHIKVMETSGAIRKVAREYNVLESTLRSRIRGHVDPDTTRSGPEAIFSQEEEAVSIMAENDKICSLQTESTELDSATRIVSSVIHEYDIIDNSENETTLQIMNKMDQQGQTDVDRPFANVAEIDTNSKGENSLPVPSIKTTDVDTSRSHKTRLSISESVTDESAYRSNCPPFNCKEKIIICMDNSTEMDQPSFRSRSGDKFTPRELVKKGVRLFLENKSRLDKKHEYALLLLQETAVWVRDFSNNPCDIQVALDDIVEGRPCDVLDVSSVFDQILEHADLPPVDVDVSSIPPPYLVRIIFIYSRSNCPLLLQKCESFKLLNASPYFFFDAIYIHEAPSTENRCQEMFDSICDLDEKGNSYILDVSRNLTKLYDHMAQLLAHPLQRPLQGDTSYRIGTTVVPENG